MGDPKKIRKKYDRPLHPWRREKIDSEKLILKEFGLKNKKELWKQESILRSYFKQAKKIISKDTKQTKIERKDLMNKLYKYNLIPEVDSKPEDVLTINLKNLLDRRLQTQVYKKGYARSISQARQFVVHGHIYVADRKINVPSYLVSRDEENKIRFDPLSNLTSDTHPERTILVKKEKPVRVRPEGDRRFDRKNSYNRNRSDGRGRREGVKSN